MQSLSMHCSPGRQFASSHGSLLQELSAATAAKLNAAKKLIFVLNITPLLNCTLIGRKTRRRVLPSLDVYVKPILRIGVAKVKILHNKLTDNTLQKSPRSCDPGLC